jgi:hypothetical protein
MSRQQSRDSNARWTASSHLLEVLGGVMAALLLGAGFFFAPASRGSRGLAFSASPARTQGAEKSGDTLPDKILELSQPASQPLKSSQPIVITEQEANDYLKQYGPQFLPPAVSGPSVHILADRVTGEAEVDFSKLSPPGVKTRDVGSQVLAAMFKGKQKVTAAGKLKSSDGQGQVSIQDVTIGTFAVPDWLTQLIVDNYLQQNYHLDLSKPFPLPDHVTQVELAAGKATFLRSPNKKWAPAPSR